MHVDSVQTRAGEGIVGDCQANASSPRHVLLVERAVLDDLRLTAEDVCANLVIDGESLSGLLSGTVLAIGNARIRLTLPCESCAKLNRIRPTLARELRDAVRGSRGFLGRVLTTGRVAVGAACSVAEESFPPLSESWPDRVAAIVSRLPDGMLLSYRQLAVIAGLQSSYCRAFPRVLAKLPREKTERVVTSTTESTKPFWTGADYYAVEERPP